MSNQPLPGIKQFDLTEKNAIITGGSKGLGYAMGAGLASAGANLMLMNRNLEEGEASAAKLAEDFGVKAKAYKADVTSQTEIEKVIRQITEDFGQIDILINSAGVNDRGPIDELTHEQFKNVMNVNVDGIWLISKAVVPHMKKKQKW